MSVRLNEFYSTSLNQKLNALAKINLGDLETNAADLLSAICDGCGGCEQLTENGHHLTVLWSNLGETWYVRFGESEDRVRSIFINLIKLNRTAVEDSHETYARVLLMPGWTRATTAVARNSHIRAAKYLDYGSWKTGRITSMY